MVPDEDLVPLRVHLKASDIAIDKDLMSDEDVTTYDAYTQFWVSHVVHKAPDRIYVPFYILITFLLDY